MKLTGENRSTVGPHSYGGLGARPPPKSKAHPIFSLVCAYESLKRVYSFVY